MLLAPGHPAQAASLLKEAMLRVAKPARDIALLSLAYADLGEIEAAEHAVEERGDDE